MYVLFCIFCFHHANWHSPATLTEVFPCFFLTCKANARVYLAKKGHGPHSSYSVNCVVLCIVLCRLCCSMYCLCVNVYYCHRVPTKLQLNISYHIMCILNDLAQTAQYQRMVLFGTAAGHTGSMFQHFKGT